MVSDYSEFLLFKFDWSKTIQFGERSLISPLIQIKDNQLCPVKAYRNLMKLNLSHSAGALFALPDGKFIT